MYADYSLNTIIFREKFSFKFDISAQNSDGGVQKCIKAVSPCSWVGRAKL